jgi:hypothetical protein
MYRDLVFRPEVDSNTVETLPYDPNTEEKAQLLLDMFINGLAGGPVAGLPEPMSQEEFQFEVHKRMDRNKPSVQDVLRDKFGVGSFREGINKGIFTGAPQVRGI